MEESRYKFKIRLWDRESVEHTFKVLYFLLSGPSFYLYSLSHLLPSKLDQVPGFQERLFDFLERLNGDGINAEFVVFVVKVVHQLVEAFAQFFSEGEPFIEFPPNTDIILLTEIVFDIHKHLEQLFHLYFVGVGVRDFCDPIVLDAYVNIWELIIVSFVQISKSHPIVDNPERDIFVLFLILFEFVVVVDSSGLVHHLSVGHFASPVNINDIQHNETDIKEEAHSKANPSESVK